MSEQKLNHATFSIDRVYDYKPARVFRAFEDTDAKRRWFAQGDDERWLIESYENDFRVGGYERSRFRFNNGPLITNDTIYLDIVPNARIIIAYTMAAEGDLFSSSMSTIEFKPQGAGTKLIYTEQGLYIGDPGQAAGREHGCRDLFERLAKELARTAAAA
jgi:uncharacterized protein YndB with AHSA1/START domain